MVEKSLTIDFLHTAEAAALAAARWMGQGNNEAADHAAVEAMRQALEAVNVNGTIVIGEGERDEAPMLYIGERIGNGHGPEVDVAVDPVEGTNLVARGMPNSLSVIAVSERGGLLHAPDTYMDKLIVGPPAADKVNIDYPVGANLQIIADSLNRAVSDLTVIVLDRPRHTDLIQAVREAGARIKLISDGDIAAAISVAVSGTGVHAVMGIGGAPEGVLAAAALRCLGGSILARFKPRDEADAERAQGMGLDLGHVYTTGELARGDDLVFVATGITDGELFRGVHLFGGGARTHSLVMTYRSGTIRFVDTVHIVERRAVGVVRL
jgi:fructose-1,6-bisphosphatase II